MKKQKSINCDPEQPCGYLEECKDCWEGEMMTGRGVDMEGNPQKRKKVKVSNKKKKKVETEITCNSDGYCLYRYQTGSMLGCGFKGYCDFQRPLDKRLQR